MLVIDHDTAVTPNGGLRRPEGHLRSRRLRVLGATLVLALSVAAPSTQAKRLYKFQDENGIWHFTDRKPDTDQPVEERLVEVDPSSPISMRQEKLGKFTRYHFRNHRHGPIEVEISLKEARNVQADPSLPRHFVLPDHGEHLLLTIGPGDDRGGYAYQMVYRPMLGDPGATPQRDFAYQVPFQTGQKFYIGQGFGGSATHTEPESRHALDISMPEGTPVTAARGGIVMHVEEDFFGGGKNINRYGDRANHVRVVHEDGTMAIYAHLQTESVAVRGGQVVAAGELLGLSGNTGYSTGPHLHFAIQYNKGMALRTLPFTFADGQGGSFRPKAGHWLEHGRGRIARLGR